uniref:Uncharacterized protein n=1 Tax=Aureoumbra lagunensis TaxID=44058 RepID=A0A7S3JXL4_9STRA
MEDRADTRSPHELFETAVQEIALEGRHGCNWDRVWEMIKLDDKSMRNVIEKMLQKSNRVVIIEDDETDEILIASAWERVRALGISQPYVVLDETELRILEIVGKHRENGCSWVNTAALLKKYQEPKYFKNEMNALPQQAILLPDAWSQNVLKKKDNAQYGDQLAMERMVHAKIIEKELVSSYQKGGSRITVNTLRLARYCTDEISTSTQQQITGGMDAWKRALRFRLMYVMNDYAQSKKDAAEKKKNDDEKTDNQDKKSPPSIVSGIQSSYLILSQPENVIATLPFADVLKKIKDENWMKKIEYLMGINGPETSLQKAAHMMEICKKVTAKDDTIILFSTKVIPLKQSDENDETKKRRKSRATTNGNERDLWCVGIKKTVYPLDFIDLIPGRLDRRGKEDSLMFATSTNIPQYSVHPGGSSLLPTKLPIYHYGALRTIYENIRASGTKAGRARVLSESLQQDTNKIVEKCITHLVRSGYVQLRRITEGRMHSYLAFENHAFRVYNLCDDALALAESEKVLQKSKNEETMRQRPIFIIDDPSFPEPFDKQIHSGGENSNQMPHQLDTTAQTNQLKKYTVIAIDGNQDISLPKTNNENTKKRSDRRDMSYILGKTIHKHATAERQRRAAHVIATLTKLKAVEKGNLQIALYRRSNSERSKSKYRVDHKTWKRLLDQLVSTGELNQGTYPVENDESITIISAPTATEQDIQKYINDRQRRKKEQIQAVKTAAENRKKAEEEKKKKIDEKNFKKKKRRKKVQSILPPPPPPPLPKDQEHLYQHNKHQLAPPRPRRKTRKDPKKEKNYCST